MVIISQMQRLSSIVVALLLSCQLSFAAALESFQVASNEIHQALSHEQAIDHHHHDAWVTYLDHANADPSHQHSTDNFQTSALLDSGDDLTITMASCALSSFHLQESPSVFLDGLLRPPLPTV